MCLLSTQAQIRSTENIGFGDITIIELAGNGDVWAGSRGQGVAFYQAAGSSWTYYNQSNTATLPSDTITAIVATAFAGSQHAVIGTTNGAIDFIDATPTTISSLPEPTVRGVVYVADSLWILTNSKLTRYDSLLSFKSTANSPLPNITCTQRGTISCGGVWAGTANNGCFYTDNGTTFKYIDTSVANQKLVDNRVNAIAVDNQCVAKFIGTKGGFSVCPIGNPCQNFTTANGLPQNDIVTISTGCGTTWLGTRDSGVVMFNPPATFTRITTANGLTDNRIKSISSDPQTCKTYIAMGDGNIAIADSTKSIVEVYNGVMKISVSDIVVRVFPQPASNTINFMLESELSNATLQLTDVTGRVIATTSIWAQQQTSIDVAGLQQGIYFYQLVQNLQIIKTGKVDIVR
jgi:ligand-binding sensor domain-containing protein